MVAENGAGVLFRISRVYHYWKFKVGRNLQLLFKGNALDITVGMFVVVVEANFADRDNPGRPRAGAHRLTDLCSPECGLMRVNTLGAPYDLVLLGEL